MPAAPRLTRSAGPTPKPGIVHLGLGAFFRAFGAIYVQEAMQAAGGDWGIIGVSLQSPVTRDLLVPQGGVYTALELAPGGPVVRVVSSVMEVLFAPADPAAVLARMASPATRIVSLTVTEKGYCTDPATGHLNLSHPDIRHDLANAQPRSAPGYLVRALALRRQAGIAPFTVLSCDNLPGNGTVARRVVLGLAQAIDQGLANWIAAEVRFPATMVDRIVPASMPAPDAHTRLTGHEDRAMVLHEPFRQWVIEDSFVNHDRPAFERVGVQMVADVTAHEQMKLRMLNGAHSALAYLGYLAGYATIADTVADPVFAAYVKTLWHDEIGPALTPPQGEDLAGYAAALATRFANSAIRHRTWQIAMDGSQKLPFRILGTIADNHAAGRASPGLTLAVAGWMRYVGGVDEAGQPIDVKDPLALRLRALSDAADGAAAKVAALLSVREVFGADHATLLRAPLTAAYERLVTVGARAAARNLTRP